MLPLSLLYLRLLLHFKPRRHCQLQLLAP
jgi:hypothetical protein